MPQVSRHLCHVFICVLVTAVCGYPVFAQSISYPDAAQSDPRTIGWMVGFPPPADKLIMLPESNFFSFPKLRWSVCHIRQLLPTKQISRGIGAPVALKYALDDGIDTVTFTPLGGGEPMTWRQSLAHNYTDGILIIHQGRVVYERYFGALTQTGKHAAMSMTKSLTGLMAEILVVEGTLDETARVATIIPELAQSAFGSATVRQVMDMTTALDFSEDYGDPEADIWAYSRAGQPFAQAAGI
jgi:CubicO group peptidase (beta-lactamase class C family)